MLHLYGKRESDAKQQVEERPAERGAETHPG
jgi:hypothetical protein